MNRQSNDRCYPILLLLFVLFARLRCVHVFLLLALRRTLALPCVALVLLFSETHPDILLIMVVIPLTCATLLLPRRLPPGIVRFRL